MAKINWTQAEHLLEDPTGWCVCIDDIYHTLDGLVCNPETHTVTIGYTVDATGEEVEIETTIHEANVVSEGNPIYGIKGVLAKGSRKTPKRVAKFMHPGRAHEQTVAETTVVVPTKSAPKVNIKPVTPSKLTVKQRLAQVKEQLCARLVTTSKEQFVILFPNQHGIKVTSDGTLTMGRATINLHGLRGLTVTSASKGKEGSPMQQTIDRLREALDQVDAHKIFVSSDCVKVEFTGKPSVSITAVGLLTIGSEEFDLHNLRTETVRG